VNAAKRQWLAVESMKYVRSPVRLILAGKEEDLGEAGRIEQIIRDNGLRDRVSWQRGFIPEKCKADFLSRALGTVYIPYDEDSYGYVTLESYFSRKPVITCTDSGGTDLLVKDGITGLVVGPDPRAIAEAIDRLYQDKRAAQCMGDAGLDLIRNLGITWERVIDAVTQ
jgi:glycosyltransferase involved in cell wall biosynthesis